MGGLTEFAPPKIAPNPLFIGVLRVLSNMASFQNAENFHEQILQRIHRQKSSYTDKNTGYYYITFSEFVKSMPAQLLQKFTIE